MRNYSIELQNRIKFIHDIIAESGANGIIYGNSGGKDSTLVGILCKMACANTVGIVMPCESKCNYTVDKSDALLVSEKFNIETREVDLSVIKSDIINSLNNITELNDGAISNIAPRIRMIVLYAIAKSENRLVAGTGNRSEGYMGYFTKWGDGAFDFNPISDLTVTEIYEFLKYVDVPESIINKAPSAGLYEGQTDEGEMGVKYESIDNYLLNNSIINSDKIIIDKFHKASEHKRSMPIVYGGNI